MWQKNGRQLAKSGILPVFSRLFGPKGVRKLSDLDLRPDGEFSHQGASFRAQTERELKTLFLYRL